MSAPLRAGALVGLPALVAWGGIVALQRPTGADAAALAAYLAVAGLAAVVAGRVGSRVLPQRARTVRAQVALAVAAGSALALASVGVVAWLMFLSSHDLAVLTGMLAFALGASLHVSLEAGRGPARTLTGLSAAVERMGAGDLTARAPVEGAGQVAELAAAFNAMAERLERAFAREREVERSRADLVSAVSHDLRTPVASLRALVESINDGVVTDEQTVRRYLRTMQRETEHLSQLIADLFEVARLDAGLLELHCEPASLGDLVSDTLMSMGLAAREHGLRLDGEADARLAPVRMDTPRVGRVLRNLVQNAIRHTPADGSVSVSVRDAGEAVEVHVSDTGEGIAPGELERVFERSYRSDHSRARANGGAGLGLAIARGIVEAHGGRIWAQSQPGQGAEFVFTLPKSGPRREPEPARR